MSGWVYKHTRSPGSSMVAEYECDQHGRFYRTVPRDDAGDPPEAVWCWLPSEHHDGNSCGRLAEWRPTSAFTRVQRVTAMSRAKDSEPPPMAVDWKALAYDERPPEEVHARERRKTQDALRKVIKGALR